MTAIPHLGFIVAAYGFTVAAIGGTIVALVRDQHRQKRLLARFDRRGGSNP